MTVVYELPFEKFPLVRPLYAPAHFDEACYESAILGWQPASIFVDDLDAPNAAIMCRSYEYFVAGDPVAGASLRQFIKDAPSEANTFQYLYGFAPLNEAWKAALLADHPTEIIDRQNFRWEPGTPVMDWRGRIDVMNNTPVPTPPGASGGKPAQIRVVPLDRELAERADDPAEGVFPVPFVRMWWGSYENYLAHGYAYALMIGDTIASVAGAVSVSPRHAIISIDTAERYWRKGYATLVCAAFIEETLRRGLLPVWDTDLPNIRSADLARKLGFVEKEPFVEVAMPERKPLPLTTGLWSADPARDDGVIVWRRR